MDDGHPHPGALEGVVKALLAVPQGLLHHDAPSRLQPGAQFQRIKRFGQVVVRPGPQPVNQILALISRRYQDHVDVAGSPGRPDQPAYLRAVHVRHHPIQHCQARPVLGLQKGQRLRTIFCRNHLISPTGQQADHRVEHCFVIIDHQHFQRRAVLFTPRRRFLVPRWLGDGLTCLLSKLGPDAHPLEPHVFWLLGAQASATLRFQSARGGRNFSRTL
jgi:hypothetical protein